MQKVYTMMESFDIGSEELGRCRPGAIPKAGRRRTGVAFEFLALS
ncbi:MAG: hypothetical protein ACREQW_02225 [Candidatus Binatia bacterium]